MLAIWCILSALQREGGRFAGAKSDKIALRESEISPRTFTIACVNLNALFGTSEQMPLE